MHACVRACVRCVHACVHVFVRACARVLVGGPPPCEAANLGPAGPARWVETGVVPSVQKGGRAHCGRGSPNPRIC
eukprot:14726565-Alexandrium_andersonii.AAC.1